MAPRPEHPELLAALSRYQAAVSPPSDATAGLDAVRFCVLDCETTGLDPQKHRIVSIGAIGVSGGEIDLGDTLEVLLQVRFNTASTLVHGITRSETRNALTEPDALAALVSYLQDGIIVGHHIGYDLRMIDAALARYSDERLANAQLDTGALFAQLVEAGAFHASAAPDDYSLDGLCRFFGIIPRDRHTASGDAFLTASILIRLLRAARRIECGSLGSLLALAARADA